MSEHDIAAQWLEKAAVDLQSADALFSVGIAANACYFAQQAGEKALKSYLSLMVDEIPKTHNMGQLCKQCMETDASFSEILRISSELTDFATTTRYPGSPDYTKDDAEDAIQKAGRIFVFTQEHIEMIEQVLERGFDDEPEQSGPTMRMSF